jgi:PepSY-associated TM region
MKLKRWLFLAHRYLGIVLGLLMLVWCLSGVVMMYVSYPSLAEGDRLQHLAPIDWHRCCAAIGAQLADDAIVDRFQIEMLADRPVLRVRPQDGRSLLIDLLDGRALDGIDETQAAGVARSYGVPAGSERIDDDQWTVSGDFTADRPLSRVTLAGREGRQLYVSSRTGKAVQMTTRSERFWNWLGAIPHWLYFTELRRTVAVWSQIVIWTSLIGCVLTMIGLYIGISRLGRGAGGGWSPYRGVLFWHHLPALVFGLFTLSWVASGFISMNPWGFLDAAGDGAERLQLQGAPLSGAQVKAAVQAAAATDLPPGTVSLASAPFDGALYVIATAADGSRHRLDATGQPVALPDLARVADRLGGGTGAAMTQEDEYYFSHHEAVRLPVYRLIGDDPEQTRFYIDPVSAEIVRKVDADSRWYRWLHEGPHRLDLVPGLRARPLWDGLMLLLLAGVTGVCGTGAYLGLRRLLRRPAARQHRL